MVKWLFSTWEAEYSWGCSVRFFIVPTREMLKRELILIKIWRRYAETANMQKYA